MRLFVPVGRYCLRFLPRTKPVPIGQIRLLRKISLGTDSLFPSYSSLMQTGKGLRNPVLSQVLADDEMGTWSMSPATLNLLEAQIQTHKPGLVLELGSGLSTVCLARYMQELHGSSDRIYVCSIEQNNEVIERVRKRLGALSLDRHVRLFHAPLAGQTIEGAQTTCYALPSEFVTTMEMLHPDFVVIDGPAAEHGARFGTVPLARPFVTPNARFYLDDALRDGEIHIAERWTKLPYVHIKGMYLTEKGLLAGEVEGGAR